MKLRKAIGLMLLFTASLSGLGSCSMTGPQGSQGEQGIQGQPGKDGSSLLTGNGKPDSNLGKNGDSYIDLDTWNYYIKTNAGWVLQGNIKANSKDHDGTEGLEFYPLNDTECAVAVGSAKLLKEIIIPSTYKNYAVTSIFGGPSGISGLDYGGFAGCLNLEKITIPNSVTNIGTHAFQNCSSLTSIVISDSVTSIGDNAFYNCSSLTSIVIPDSVTSIGDNAFDDCSSLTHVTIGNSVTSIGHYAFSGCTSLSSIVIPDSVTFIGCNAFYYCSSLTIYCEAPSEPSGWNIHWDSNRPFYWADKWEYDADGNPTPII